jgi:hypothetical protein
MLAPARGSVILFASCCFLLLLVIPLGLSASRQPESNSPVSVAELTSRADSGDVSAQQQLARFLLRSDPNARGYDLALAWLQSFARQNNPRARVLLGWLYENGRGLPRDYAKAAENYQAAALQNLSAAQDNLGKLYELGLGVPKNERKAFELYLAAAQQANPVARLNLASMYLTGSGTPRDFFQAARWFRVAAESGYVLAQHALAILDSKGLGVPVDRAEAARWELLAAQRGLPLAETGLAFFYETGSGVPLDYVSAFCWYSRAVSDGEESAASRLKALSHIMTSKQIQQAKALLSAQSAPPSSATNATDPGDSMILSDVFGPLAPNHSQ